MTTPPSSTFPQTTSSYNVTTPTDVTATSTASGDVIVSNRLRMGVGSRLVVQGKLAFVAGASVEILPGGQIQCGILQLDTSRRRGITPVQAR